jgi:hypothetical protein
MKGICENCKQPFPYGAEWQQFSAQCHILDKDTFPEVALVLENHFEGCLACHDNYDNAPEAIVLAMPILPTLRVRLRSFINSVLPHNQNKIPHYLC